jgi:hypothetical protein
LKLVQQKKEGSYKIFDYEGPAKNLGQVKDAMDRFYDEQRN